MADGQPHLLSLKVMRLSVRPTGSVLARYNTEEIDSNLPSQLRLNHSSRHQSLLQPMLLPQ